MRFRVALGKVLEMKSNLGYHLTSILLNIWMFLNVSVSMPISLRRGPLECSKLCTLIFVGKNGKNDTMKVAFRQSNIAIREWTTLIWFPRGLFFQFLLTNFSSGVAPAHGLCGDLFFWVDIVGKPDQKLILGCLRKLESIVRISGL